MKKELIEKIALDRFPENWQNEQYSPAICPKQYDINKEERGAFIEGYMLSQSSISDVIKNDLSVVISCEYESDFGRVYNIVKADLIFGDETISTSSIQLDIP